MSEIIDIRPVRRESAKLVIGLAGESGTGKTYSALQVALGLANGDPGKIGLLDTENRRGSLYDRIFDRPFLIGDLTPPFSPDRYCRAMRHFATKGIEVLVIDSITHEWEGEGGCEEIAMDAKLRGKKMADWIGAKREHKRFMNTLLFLPMHVIACVRAREKTDFTNPDKPKSRGVQPITEKNVMFEMTVSFLLQDEGFSRQSLKLPECLRSIFGDGKGYLTSDHGRALREWIGGADNTEERSKSALRLAASEGTEALKAAWLSLGKAEQRSLSAFKDTLKDLAAHADSEKTAPIDRGEPENLEGSPDAEW